MAEVTNCREALRAVPDAVLKKKLDYMAYRLIVVANLQIKPIASLLVGKLILPTEWKTPPLSGHVMLSQTSAPRQVKFQVWAPLSVRRIIRQVEITPL